MLLFRTQQGQGHLGAEARQVGVVVADAPGGVDGGPSVPVGGGAGLGVVQVAPVDRCAGVEVGV